MGPSVPHHLIGRLPLVNDQRLRTFAHRIEQNSYGSEGWGFESLRARKTAGQGLISRYPFLGEPNNLPVDRLFCLAASGRKLCTALRDHLSGESPPPR